VCYLELQAFAAALLYCVMPPGSVRDRLRKALADPTPDSPLAGTRAAAIALILLEAGESFEVLLIERAERAGDPWSGHMALPGGHVDPADADLAATAERETWEEVGLDLSQGGERLGRVSDHAPAQGLPIRVRPFVYLLQARPTLRLGEEVRNAFWVPVAPLQRGEQSTTFRFERAGQSTEFPAWDIHGRVVWGLTYRVLDEFLRRYNEVSGPATAALDNSQQAR
jgi:8-oxo-dGTP pyrophosphatase MutT (NUDIX family)